MALQSLESNPQLSSATRMEDWTSLGQHKRHPEFPVVTRELLQLEKNHVVPPSSQDEALSRYSASGEVPREDLEVETVPQKFILHFIILIVHIYKKVGE